MGNITIGEGCLKTLVKLGGLGEMVKKKMVKK
jgi:hypothetical protein